MGGLLAVVHPEEVRSNGGQPDHEVVEFNLNQEKLYMQGVQQKLLIFQEFSFCDLSPTSTGLLLVVQIWTGNGRVCALRSHARMSCTPTCSGWEVGKNTMPIFAFPFLYIFLTIQKGWSHKRLRLPKMTRVDANSYEIFFCLYSKAFSE